MEVLMIGWELPPQMTGGLGEASYRLAKALSRHGVNITFVLPRKVNYHYDFMNVLSADVSEVNRMISAYRTLKYFRDNGKIKDIPHDYVQAAFEYAEKIGVILKNQKFDIIHAHDWLSIPAGLVARETLTKPFVVHVHATEMDRTGGHYPNDAVFEIESEGVKKADKVIAVSNLTKKILVKHYGADEKKISVVHNGIDYSGKKKLAPTLVELKKLGYKIVLFHGRITLQKGPEYFVRAAKKVSEYYDKAIFVVSGSGDMQEQMMNEVVHLGLAPKFIFAGALWGHERDRLIQSCDVHVMTSVSEPFGIVPLEVVANGIPTIVSKTAGVSEVLSNALKIDFWDIEEIANKIIAVLSHNELKNTLILESEKELKNISWEKSAHKCMHIYNSLS